MEALLDRSVGRTARVLVEQGGRGYSEDYLPVRLDFPAPAGGIARVRLTRRDAGGLIGEQAA